MKTVLRFISAILICALILTIAAFADTVRSNERTDYPDLTDAEFANFRMITLGDIEDGMLYRSSSPINPEIGRNEYADDQLQQAGIRFIIDLADSKDSAEAHTGYAGSCFSDQEILYLDMNRDFTSKRDREGFAKMIRYIAENDGPFLIHCDEGKTRTGFASILLEGLMGADPEDVIGDYMLSYVYYFGITPESDEYHGFEKSIRTAMMFLIGGKELTGDSLRNAAVGYFMDCGVTEAELDAVIARLAGEVSK